MSFQKRLARLEKYTVDKIFRETVLLSIYETQRFMQLYALSSGYDSLCEMFSALLTRGNLFYSESEPGFWRTIHSCLNWWTALQRIVSLTNNEISSPKVYKLKKDTSSELGVLTKNGVLIVKDGNALCHLGGLFKWFLADKTTRLFISSSVSDSRVPHNGFYIGNTAIFSTYVTIMYIPPLCEDHVRELRNFGERSITFKKWLTLPSYRRAYSSQFRKISRYPYRLLFGHYEKEFGAPVFATEKTIGRLLEDLELVCSTDISYIEVLKNSWNLWQQTRQVASSLEHEAHERFVVSNRHRRFYFDDTKGRSFKALAYNFKLYFMSKWVSVLVALHEIHIPTDILKGIMCLAVPLFGRVKA